MSESLFSRSWYRVAPLQPRLRSHVQIHSHRYRGEQWYVIQDRFTGRHHRFSPEAYQIIGLLDGKRTLAQIWEQACRNLGDHMPTQDEVIALLAQLFRADLLQSSALPNIADLEQRRTTGRQKRLLASLRSPMFVRIPLLDPDRFLTATMPLVAPLLSWPAVIGWGITVACSILLAFMHWPDLTNNLTDQVLALENILLVTLIYPVLKAVHEFGHAYAVKKWGGEVHEMGVILLVFIPIPYVDASSSLAFRSKYKRMFVGGAGIMIEVLLAALALLVWLRVEPGPIRVAAFNIMLIAGISTLLFNGNPLLRFDAYYVLADFLEIPNLGQKANRYLGYLCQRYLLGVERLESAVSTTTERFWLVSYGILSFCYRIFISIRIMLFVAGKFFFIGLLLAVWVAVGMVVIPLSRLVSFVFKNHQMKARRKRIFFVIVLPLACLAALLLCYPLPSYTLCEGVTWAPEESRLYVDSSGFVAELHAENGSLVRAGDPLLKLRNEELASKVRLMRARLEEYEARYNLGRQKDINEAMLLQEALDQIRAELTEVVTRQQGLTVSAATDGIFILGEPDIIGRYLRRGEAVGYILAPEKLSLRVVVPQAGIDKVRGDTQTVEVRLADDIARVSGGEIIGEVPAASRELPSLALSTQGGGPFALDPREKERPMVLEHLFQFDVAVDTVLLPLIGERAYIRFEHNPEPLYKRLYRAVRRLLLSRFAF